MASKVEDKDGTSFTVTNWTNAVSLDCNGGAIATTDDVLGTLIKTLQEQGILKGSVAA